MRLSIIAALSSNGVIGIDNRLPWRIPEDLARFKRLTIGHCVIMGRKTYESIGRPLPRRTNIVVSRRATELPPEVRVARSIPEAIGLAPPDDEVFVAGGAEVYRQTIGRAWRLYLTHVHASVEGDTFFPELDRSLWTEVEREDHAAAGAAPAYSFVTYERARAAIAP